MIVEVKFFRKSAMAYVGRGYSYDTEMPLKVGDRVIVPAVNVPEESVNPDYFPLKKIEEYDVPEVDG